MRRFSLRHLFLLTSLLCLWFGVYAVWRNVLVFALPLCVGVASLIVYLVPSNKEESVRLKRLAWATIFNLVCGVSVGFLVVRMDSEPLRLSIAVYLLELLFQGGYLSFQSLLFCGSASRKMLMGVGIYLFLMNFAITSLMLLPFLFLISQL